MTRVAAQSLAGAMAAFLAVTPLAHRDHRRPVVPTVAAQALMLAGVGMPNTGPGNIRVKRLTIVVRLGAMLPSPRAAAEAELKRLDTWLTAHHGRKRLTLLYGRAVTRLLAPSTPAAAPMHRIKSARRFVRHELRRSGQHLIVSIGRGNGAESAPRVASLRVSVQPGAPVLEAVETAEGRKAEARVDTRRHGALAATIARAVISLTHMQEAR